MKPRHYYILGVDGRQPIAVDATAWARWFKTAGEARQVALAENGDVSVSTVFLGLDHQYSDGPPHIFETMIFNGDNSEWVDRCSTWEQAEAMHQKACVIAWPTPALVETESEA